MLCHQQGAPCYKSLKTRICTQRIVQLTGVQGEVNHAAHRTCTVFEMLQTKQRHVNGSQEAVADSTGGGGGGGAQSYLKQAKLSAGGLGTSAAQHIHLAQAQMGIPTTGCAVGYITRPPPLKTLINDAH